MARRRRVFAPGVGLHVVACTQGRAHWFTEDIRAQLSHDIDEAAACSGHRVLGRVVMPDHFHIILKHGHDPLGWMMQRVMQRTAFRVKKSRDVAGHVFGQRYWAEPCPTPRYLRRAIVYVHMNPVKAGICNDPQEYEWSTHNRYVALADERVNDFAGHLDGLMLFADESVTRCKVVANYLRFVNFCQERRRDGIAGDWLHPGSVWFSDAPTATHGDVHFAETFSAFDGGSNIPRPSIDVYTMAVNILRRIDQDLTLDDIRHGARLKALSNPTKALVCALLSGGCRSGAVARTLCLSPSFVSRIKTAMRLSAAQQQ